MILKRLQTENYSTSQARPNCRTQTSGHHSFLSTEPLVLLSPCQDMWATQGEGWQWLLRESQIFLRMIRQKSLTVTGLKIVPKSGLSRAANVRSNFNQNVKKNYLGRRREKARKCTFSCHGWGKIQYVFFHVILSWSYTHRTYCHFPF